MAELSRQIEVMYKLGYECRNCGSTFFKDYPLVLFTENNVEHFGDPVDGINLIISRGHIISAHKCEITNSPIGIGDLTSAEVTGEREVR